MTPDQTLALLDVMECLIDAAAAGPRVERIYDDAASKSVTWPEIWASYQNLKAVAGVE